MCSASTLQEHEPGGVFRVVLRRDRQPMPREWCSLRRTSHSQRNLESCCKIDSTFVCFCCWFCASSGYSLGYQCVSCGLWDCPLIVCHRFKTVLTVFLGGADCLVTALTVLCLEKTFCCTLLGRHRVFSLTVVQSSEQSTLRRLVSCSLGRCATV